MEETINYKRLYELSIIEKEKIILENEKLKELNIKLINEVNSYKIENYSKKNYYEKNKEIIKEKIKEYKKNHNTPPEKIKEYNKRAYEKRKHKLLEKNK
jgi:hypothetical protein